MFASALSLLVCLSWSMGCETVGPDATVLTSQQTAATSEKAAYTLAEPEALPERLDIPLARSDGYLLVPTYLNGESAGLMMIDTGASLSVIAQGVAGSLGLPKDGAGRTLGVGGFEDFDYRRAEHFSIGQPTSTIAGQKNAQRGVLQLERER